MKRNPLNPMVVGEPDWISKLFESDQQDQQDQSDAEQYINDALASLSSLTQNDQPDQSQTSSLSSDNSDNIDPNADTGLPESDKAAFDWIIDKESKGNPRATNPSSGAFGRGQFLPSNLATYAKKAGVSNPRTTDPAEQDRMALVYMNERYGGPKQAQAFWKKHGWY
jgi:hypothetical protein